MRRNRHQSDESGATLILALVFIVISGLLFAALLTLSGTNLRNTANLQNERGLEYAAGGAVESAIQVARYNASNCPLPAAMNPFSFNSDQINVFCSPATAGFLRQPTFYACPSTDATLATCQSNKDLLLQAVVQYNDLKTGCTSSLLPGCNIPVYGQSLQLISWTQERADS
jgi:Tfp pilus assembly protein PilX